MATWLRPEMIDLLLIHATNALAWCTWYFDMLCSFVVSFCFLYGLIILTEKVIPRRLGERPRVWWVPCLFAATLIGFPLFLDALVSRVIYTSLGYLPWWPEMWFVQSLTCLWLSGCIVVLFRTLRNFARLEKMDRFLPTCPENPILAAAIAAAGVRGKIEVKIGPSDMPIISFGLLRKRIIIPEGFTAQYSSADQFAILLHECVHIRNHDQRTLFFLSLVKTVLWFDPVAKHAFARVRTSMELLCDWTVVTTHRVDRDAYAVLIVNALAEPRPAAPGFSNTYRLASHRLSHILGDSGLDVPSRISRRRAAFLLVGLAALLAAAVGMYAGLDPVQPADMESLKSQGYEVVHHAERSGVFSRYVHYTITR